MANMKRIFESCLLHGMVVLVGFSIPAIAQSPIGPSYDCGRATDALALVICADDHLRRADVAMVQPYYVLRHIQPERAQELRQQAADFQRRVLDRCGLPARGQVEAPNLPRVKSCVSELYQHQRVVWLNQIQQHGNAAALEEAGRDVATHVTLQGQLKSAGYLPADATIDGAYGPATRGAIVRFQRDQGQETSGLLSAATASVLLRGSSQVAQHGQARSNQPPSTPVEPQSDRRQQLPEIEQMIREYRSREKTILEQILNYTTFSDEDGMFSRAGGDFWISGHNSENKCIMTRILYWRSSEEMARLAPARVSSNRIDIRAFNANGFRMGTFPGTDVFFIGDDRTTLENRTLRVPSVERIRRAWALAFRECPPRQTPF
jgi:hypothetical protein